MHDRVTIVLILIICILIGIVCFVSCSKQSNINSPKTDLDYGDTVMVYVDADINSPKTDLDYGDTVMVYVDADTGVNYLIYSGNKKGGITVRYDSDGNIMVDKKYVG